MDTITRAPETDQQAPDALQTPRTPKRKPSLASVSLPEPDAIDSGYNTGSTNTPGPLDHQPLDCPRGDGPVPGTSGHGNLYRFDQPVPSQTIDQYKRISAQLEPDLVQYMQKYYRTHSPIVIRLMILGSTADEAKPWLVVFCDKKREARVRRFFRKNFSRAIEQSGNGSELSSKALILPLGIQLLGSESFQILTNMLYARNTLCGVPIIVSSAVWYAQTRRRERATLGGLIKVGRSNGDFELFGLTAAHVLGPIMPETPEILDGSDTFDSSDDSDDDFATESGTSGFLRSYADLSIADDFSSPRPLSEDFETDVLGYSWSSPGLGQNVPLVTNLQCNKFDFSLFRMKSSAIIQPNRLRQGKFGIARHADLRRPSVEEAAFTSDRPVVLNVSSDKCHSGVLISLPCSVWLDRIAGFVQAHPIQMDAGSKLENGYSGTWVVEAHTSKVYGHLIASDNFGDGYIIPMLNTLESIRAATGAEVVDLATTLDVTCKRDGPGPNDLRRVDDDEGAVPPSPTFLDLCSMSAEITLDSDDESVVIPADSGYGSVPVSPDPMRVEVPAASEGDYCPGDQNYDSDAYYS